MSDIVERLRNAAETPVVSTQLTEDAADEIERLQKRLDAEYAKGDKLANDVIHQQMYIERLLTALERIAAIPVHHVGWREIAREALEKGDE